jgi:hypothetical protein
MQDNNAAVYWLILATSISGVTSTFLYLLSRCCGTCWSNIGSIGFQSFASSLDLREESFNQVTNLFIFPRIIQQLQLKTFKVAWNHDANAQTGDYVQWGWLRLPTKSYVLAFLAIWGVTHYIFIPKDLKSVEIVGPAVAISTLIDLSNTAVTTTHLSEIQLTTLRKAFGMDGGWTEADKVCTLWERRFVVCVVGASYLCLVLMIPGSTERIVTMLLGLVSVVLLACRYILTRMDRVWPRLLWRVRSQTPDNDNAELLHNGDDRQEMEMVGSGAPPDISDDPKQSGQVQVVGESSDTNSSYISILIARSYYYEVVNLIRVIPIPGEASVSFRAEANMYAIRLRPNFVHYLAERTTIPDNASLHVCIYNPMIHPYLTEMYQNFQKASKGENLCLIILPPLAELSACFDSPLARTRTAKCTHYVTTLADFEALLLEMTAGFMPKLVFVLPIDEESQTSSKVWLSAERVLGIQNCHWSSRPW